MVSGRGTSHTGACQWVGVRGGIPLGEIPRMQQTTMAHVYLCNKCAHSAHVPQNLKNKIIIKKKKERKKEKAYEKTLKIHVRHKAE